MNGQMLGIRVDRKCRSNSSARVPSVPELGLRSLSSQSALQVSVKAHSQRLYDPAHHATYLRDSSFAKSSWRFSLISRCTLSSISRSCEPINNSNTCNRQLTYLLFLPTQLFFFEPDTLACEFFGENRRIADTTGLLATQYRAKMA